VTVDDFRCNADQVVLLAVVHLGVVVASGFVSAGDAPEFDTRGFSTVVLALSALFVAAYGVGKLLRRPVLREGSVMMLATSLPEYGILGVLGWVQIAGWIDGRTFGWSVIAFVVWGAMVAFRAIKLATGLRWYKAIAAYALVASLTWAPGVLVPQNSFWSPFSIPPRRSIGVRITRPPRSCSTARAIASSRRTRRCCRSAPASSISTSSASAATAPRRPSATRWSTRRISSTVDSILAGGRSRW
jgi:hypothetical protein